MKIFFSFLIFSLVVLLTNSHAGVTEVESALRKKGAKDHSVISRYAGSSMYSFSERAFDSYSLVKTYVTGSKPTFENVQGKVTQIGFMAPHGRSVLEVTKNFEDALTRSGFNIELRITPTDSDLAEALETIAVVPDICFVNLDSTKKTYLRAKRHNAGQTTWIAVYITPNRIRAGSCSDAEILYTVDVVESKAMEANLVVVNSDTWAKSIEQEGRAELYGILFATNSSLVESSSRATLQEIIKLLSQRPQLKLYIVGHTDNIGKIDSNLKLSAERAISVMKELLKLNPSFASRLKSYGVGSLSPKSTNESENGRKQNRRVELVAQ